MKRTTTTIAIAIAVLGAASYQFDNIRAVLFRANEAIDGSLSPEQLAAKARLQLEDCRNELAASGKKINSTRRRVDLRESNLKSKVERVNVLKQELALAQRKLSLNKEATKIEIGGQIYTRAEVEADARRRLTDLKREVGRIEAEQHAIAQMRSDLNAADGRLADAESEIAQKELEIEQLAVRYQDTEAQRQLASLVPELGDPWSNLNETISQLWLPGPGPQSHNPIPYDHELEAQTPVEDSIAEFFSRDDQLLAADSE